MTKATVTIEINGWRSLAMPWESTILEQLRLVMPQYTILNVERPAFSGRYAITLDSKGASHEQLTHDFLRAMRDMDYAVDIVAVDSGPLSSAPGGLVQGVSQTVAETSQAASGFLIPAAIIAVVVFAVIYLPKPRS